VKTPWTTRCPAARKAFFGTWKTCWKKRLESGVFEPSEERSERHELVRQVTGKTDIDALDKDEFNAVMIALEAEGGGERGTSAAKDHYRVSVTRKIEHLAPSDAYIYGILARKDPSCKNWRTLPTPALRNLMLDLVSQARRDAKK
jgi:hypothetical protein